MASFQEGPEAGPGTPENAGWRQVPSESGWIATFSKPRFHSSIKLTMESKSWSQP